MSLQVFVGYINEFQRGIKMYVVVGKINRSKHGSPQKKP